MTRELFQDWKLPATLLGHWCHSQCLQSREPIHPRKPRSTFHSIIVLSASYLGRQTKMDVLLEMIDRARNSIER